MGVEHLADLDQNVPDLIGRRLVPQPDPGMVPNFFTFREVVEMEVHANSPLGMLTRVRSRVRTLVARSPTSSTVPILMIGSRFSGIAVRKSEIAARGPLVPAFESPKRVPEC